MPWSTPTSTDGVVAIHAALIPSLSGDGSVIMLGGDNHDLAAARADDFDHARLLDCAHPSNPVTRVTSPSFDVFCCGQAFTGDGRLLVAGGTEEFPADAGGIHHERHFDGHRHAAVFDIATGMFRVAEDMGSEPGNGSLGGGRWYPTLCTLASGEVYAFQGHPLGTDRRHGNNTPERYQPLADQWALEPAVGDVSGDPILYPRLHLLRDGWILVTSLTPGFGRMIAVDPYTSATREVADLSDAAYHGFGGSSVLLPLTPADGYRERVLLCGGTTSQFIDLGAASPAWQNVPRTGSAAAKRRVNCNATLLPTGDVVLTGGSWGGTGAEFDDQQGVFEPEIYRPTFDLETRTYSPGVGEWETENDAATVHRNYHSTALLFPDGRVWTGGGNSASQPGSPPGTAQQRSEIYSPPYPAGARPQLTDAPRVVAWGEGFTITVPSAENIGSVVLVRCGTATHSFNVDQRLIVCEFERTASNQLRVAAPPNGNVAPPGNYLLFVVDHQRRPCDKAKFVRVGGRISMFTNRSHLSLHEVQAVLPSGGYIPAALYVVLDGFTSADMSDPTRPFPPTMSFSFVGGGTVPGLTAEHTQTLFESPTAAPDVAQRITLAYRLHFADAHAFDGIAGGDERIIDVIAAWGSSLAHGQLHVFQHEHVYAMDGPTSWLSVDVRVTSRARIGDPIAYVQNTVSQYRGAPNDEFHPFLSLATGQDASRLELSPTVRGVTIDNYAFAKVRFRAPAGITANDVKVFFRLFTTAATNLDYDTTTVYRRLGSGAGAVALTGMVGGAVASMPFFASARGTDPTTQPDPTNVVTMTGTGADEVTAYFGCWLDFNHATALRNQVRGRHQCLVAEIHYPPSAIPAGATPSNNDQLSQRNLAIVESDNPGGPAAHTVTHTFELKPPDIGVPVHPKDDAELQAVPTFTTRSPHSYLPDELFIRWNDLPRDTQVTLYLPGVDVAMLVSAAARLRPGHGSVRVIDNDTVLFCVGDASYLPLPAGFSTNIPGLLTMQLPPTVHAGSRYTVHVHQVSGLRRTITSSFSVAVEVGLAGDLVEPALRDLHVLRSIGQTIPVEDRWYPVFQRYLDVLTDRVRAFGADPGTVVEPGGPSGPCGCCAPGRRVCGHVVAVEYNCYGDVARAAIDDGDTQQWILVAGQLADVVPDLGCRDLVEVILCADDERRVHRVVTHRRRR